MGLDLDPVTEEVVEQGDVVTRTHASREPGLNATASLVYRRGTLVELRFSLAL
jgi:hypothetical protein